MLTNLKFLDLSDNSIENFDTGLNQVAILFFETILNFEFLLKSNVTNFQKYIDFNNFVNLFTEELPSSLVILLLKGNPCTENAEYK